MKYDILSAGFSLVEMPRPERGVPFDVPGQFVGPFPSADTLIMLDVAARLGKKCTWMGSVANNPFGKVVYDRLEQDGIDVSYIHRLDSFCTPPVFVRYDLDGKREYLSDNTGNRLSRGISEEFIIPEVVAQSRWVHFSGEVLTTFHSGENRKAMLKMLDSLTDEQMVSLDPNDGYDTEETEKIMGPFVRRANLILPSEGEARALARTATDDEACRMWAKQGKMIALKQGERGCTIYSGDEVISVGAFSVEEVDPTGCGDSFCAGFITGLIDGLSLEETATLANACGALQATKLGPMEGAMFREDVERFIRENKR